MGCSSSTMSTLKEQGDAIYDVCFHNSNLGLTFDMNMLHPSHAPYLGSFFFASPSNRYLPPSPPPKSKERRVESPSCLSLESSPDSLTASTISTEEDEISFPDQDFLLTPRPRPDLIGNATNTLPSFRKGRPLHLNIVDSYTGKDMEDTGIALEDNFSYDPDFCSGEYIINTREGNPYGGGLRVKFQAPFSWLADQYGRILAATRSRHTSCPSYIVYSVKPFFQGQRFITQRSDTPQMNHEDCQFNLYPWALLKKHGSSMDDFVDLFLVDEHLTRQKEASSLSHFDLHSYRQSTTDNDKIELSVSGSYFCKEPAYRSQSTLQDGIHVRTIISRIISHKSTESCHLASNMNDSTRLNQNLFPSGAIRHQPESPLENNYEQRKSTAVVPCSFIRRKLSTPDSYDVTIAPGIDPLLIICSLAVHTRMDVELVLAQAHARSKTSFALV